MRQRYNVYTRDGKRVQKQNTFTILGDTPSELLMGMALVVIGAYLMPVELIVMADNELMAKRLSRNSDGFENWEFYG